jgi:hypothetical protein
MMFPRQLYKLTGSIGDCAIASGVAFRGKAKQPGSRLVGEFKRDDAIDDSGRLAFTYRNWLAQSLEMM